MKRKIKLLFVDDEEKFLKGMTERLKLRDLIVHSFNNGPDALAAARQVFANALGLIGVSAPDSM